MLSDELLQFTRKQKQLVFESEAIKAMKKTISKLPINQKEMIYPGLKYLMKSFKDLSDLVQLEEARNSALRKKIDNEVIKWNRNLEKESELIAKEKKLSEELDLIKNPPPF